MPRRHIMLITGEPSGGRIAARAIRTLRQLASDRNVDVSVFGIAGDECAHEGAPG